MFFPFWIANPKFEYQRNRCAANLMQIGLALKAYANDNDGLYPPSPVELFPRWLTGRSESLFVCPARGEMPRDWPHRRDDYAELTYSYRYVAYPTNTTQAVLAGLPIMFDKGTNHLYSGRNVLFGNGKVEWFKCSLLPAKLSSLASSEALPPACREVLKQTLKTVEEEGGK